jgi:hypothetical protein
MKNVSSFFSHSHLPLGENVCRKCCLLNSGDERVDIELVLLLYVNVACIVTNELLLTAEPGT